MTEQLARPVVGGAARPAPRPPAAVRDPWWRRRGAALATRPLTTAALVSALGLLVQVVGYAAGWSGDVGPALVLWYLGYPLLVAPWAAVLLSAALPDARRLPSGLALAGLTYLSFLLAGPVLATRFDETLHVATLVDLLASDALFTPNPMLPVSPHYPGLELATAGVHWLTGLPLMAAQVVVVALARATFVVALFLLARRVTGSARAAGLAVLLYSASPQFYVFNAQFSYQTVAIALLLAVLWLLAVACDAPQTWPWRPVLALQACLAALTVTHHLTSWITLGVLGVLAALFWWGRERRRTRVTLLNAQLAVAVAAAWTATVVPLLVFYLGPVLDEAATSLWGVLTRDGSGRRLFADASGVTTPLWEVAVMGASVLAWCLLLVPAGLAAWRGGSVGRSRARLALVVTAGAYPGLLLSRFSSAAAELGDRASTFVFMALAVVVGAWVAGHLGWLSATPVRRVGAVGAAVVLGLGGLVLGSGPDLQRVPGPYVAAGEQRSVDAGTLAVARWAGRYLPAGSRVATDSTFSRVLPDLAPVEAVTGTSGSVSATPLFLYPPVDAGDQRLLDAGEVDFVVVDTRMAGTCAPVGSFFEGSSGYGRVGQCLRDAQLDQFEDAVGFRRVLDGPVRVYDVRSLTGGDPRRFADRPDPLVPGDHSDAQLVVTGLVLLGLAALLTARRRRVGAWLRRRWRDGGLPTGLVLGLPSLMLVGAAGLAAGWDRTVGSQALVLGAVLLGALLWRAASRTPDPGPGERPAGRDRTVAGLLLAAVLLTGSVLLAVDAAWEGQLDVPLPPAPTAPGG